MTRGKEGLPPKTIGGGKTTRPAGNDSSILCIRSERWITKTGISSKKLEEMKEIIRIGGGGEVGGKNSQRVQGGCLVCDLDRRAFLEDHRRTQYPRHREPKENLKGT